MICASRLPLIAVSFSPGRRVEQVADPPDPSQERSSTLSSLSSWTGHTLRI